ncbi:MAG: bacteriocin [Clostridia bacterium]|jgi:cell shape-determining protein MreC|nr:bacteriocin [Clostridia bacterium]
MDFWSELIKIVISNGIFAMLFVYLLFYILKDSEKRENAYRKTIDELAEHLNSIEDVKQEVAELKDYLERRENEF